MRNYRFPTRATRIITIWRVCWATFIIPNNTFCFVVIMRIAVKTLLRLSLALHRIIPKSEVSYVTFAFYVSFRLKMFKNLYLFAAKIIDITISLWPAFYCLRKQLCTTHTWTVQTRRFVLNGFYRHPFLCRLFVRPKHTYRYVCFVKRIVTRVVAFERRQTRRRLSSQWIPCAYTPVCSLVFMRWKGRGNGNTKNYFNM